MKKLMPSEGLRLGCSSGSTRCVIAKNYVLGQPGGGYSAMRSYQPRPDHRTGTIVTFVEDNLVIETYEK